MPRRGSCTIRRWTAAVSGLAGLAILVTAGCRHARVEPGPLDGPSEVALSVRIEALPDVLPFDGVAQSILTVTVQDHTGAPVGGLPMTVQIVSDDTFVDVGHLSSRSVRTDGRGRAVFAYTAPALAVNPAGAPDPGTVILLQVTPSSGDFANNIGRTVQIRLVPPGTVIPSFDVTPGFAFSPEPPTIFEQIRFSAAFCAAGDRASTDCTRDPNRLITQFRWDFGDGGTATGQEVAHVFAQPGSFLVRLTVRDAFSRSAETTHSVELDAAEAPTASFVFSPTDPSVGDTVFFDATGASAGEGRTLVGYAWNFGDGTSGTGMTTSHVYPIEDGYTVTLMVTDDRGQTSATAAVVDVHDSLPVAVITFSPQTPNPGQTVHFSAEQSTATQGRTIVGYRWLFGDGETTTLGPNVGHAYALPGMYVVQLFVTDDFRETNMTAQEITVGATSRATPPAGATPVPVNGNRSVPPAPDGATGR